VRLEEFLPGRLPLAFRSRFDPVLPEDVSDGRVRELVPEIGQGALDAVSAPARILPGHPQDWIDDRLPDSGRPTDLRRSL